MLCSDHKAICECSITARIKSRFDSVMNDQEYVTAAVLRPKFKLAFLPDSDKHSQQRQSLIGYVKTVHSEIHCSTATEPAAADSSHSLSDGRDADNDNEDLYSFTEKSGTNAVDSSIIAEQMCCDSECSVHQFLA